MKGFVQIVEVAIAALLIILVLPTFFSGINVKLNWETADLIETGNYIFNSLENSGNISNILNDTQGIIRQIDNLKPKNVRYAFKVKGTSKQNVLIGCVCNDRQFEYAKEILTPAYVNNRFINFTVNKADINNINEYDVLLFINYTGFSSQKDKIENYLNSRKGILAINATYSNTNNDFNEIFNLTPTSGSATTVIFQKYEPWKNKIHKYFLGFGFDVETLNIVENKKQGYWWLWENSRQVNITQTFEVEIENSPSNIIVSENQEFYVLDPENNNYYLKVKKIWPDKSGIIIQALNTSFVFKNFAEDEEKVKGNNIIGNNFAAMTANNTALWISDFPKSDEYRTLVKAGIASLVDEFYLVSPKNVKKSLMVSTFINMCCDIPETIELIFILWYVF